MKIGWEHDVPVVNASPVNFCGVYALVNGATRRAYIGSSSSVAGRWSKHRRQLNDHNREGLSHANRELQQDWDIYGEDVFEFVLLEACPPSLLLGREQAWMDFFGLADLYNMKQAADPNRAVDAELAADIIELKETGHGNAAVAVLLGIDERQIHSIVEASYNRSLISRKMPNLWDDNIRVSTKETESGTTCD